MSAGGGMDGMSPKTFLICIAIAILIIILASGCTSKTDQNVPTEYSDYVYEVCINGHTYYKNSKRLAIRLDDDGKPVRCVGE